MKKFFWLQLLRKQQWVPTSPIRGLSGALGLVGFSFHRGPGVYHNGRKWIIWSRLGKWGYEFTYLGGSLIWRWPWVKGRKRYIDLELCTEWNSLGEIKEFWDQYFQTMEDNATLDNPTRLNPPPMV